MTRRPRRSISPERKGLYTVGLVLQLLGALGFLISFFGFASSGMRAVDSFGQSGSPFSWWIGAAICMVAMMVGGAMRKVAARGVAGSGLVLDPDRAREDLEPWARMGGGMVRDALDETGILGQDAPLRATDGDVVKVRCRECRALNDEDANFCDTCGAKL